MRGQVALEFLMTYGWAFAIILGTLGTLAYLGIFDLDVLVVDRCEFSSGVFCLDAVATQTQVDLALQNGLVITMENVSVEVVDCDVASGPTSLASGEQGIYTATCTLSPGSLNTDIWFNYTNPDSGFQHDKIGQLVYSVN